jgi:hypothetical protein
VEIEMKPETVKWTQDVKVTLKGVEAIKTVIRKCTLESGAEETITVTVKK